MRGVVVQQKLRSLIAKGNRCAVSVFIGDCRQCEVEGPFLLHSDAYWKIVVEIGCIVDRDDLLVVGLRRPARDPDGSVESVCEVTVVNRIVKQV